MRIAILTNNTMPAREGIARHVTETARRLQQRGHRVVVLARGGGPGAWQDAAIDGLRVRFYPHFALRPLHHAVDRLPLQAWLDDGADGADVIHVHLPLFPPLRTRRPLVATFHTPMLADTAAITESGLKPILARLNARLFSAAYEQWYLDHATRLTAVSNQVRAELIAGYDASGRGIEVIENGVDTDYFAFAPAADRRREIVCVGRLSWRKGLFRLLEAFALLQPKDALRLVLAGEGPLEPRLRRHAADFGIADRVEFAGFLDRARVRARLQQAALFVSPADYEGFPLTLLEAMACGTPVVATRTGPLAGGRLPLPVVAVDPTVESLAVGMGAVLGAPEEAAARATRARAAVESRYAWDRVVDRLERLYLNVCWRAA